jgi:outer membrane protein insertion porin family
VGASIIWESPFGPLRGDFAHVVQKDTGDLTQMFQLTINNLL